MTAVEQLEKHARDAARDVERYAPTGGALYSSSYGKLVGLCTAIVVLAGGEVATLVDEFRAGVQ